MYRAELADLEHNLKDSKPLSGLDGEEKFDQPLPQSFHSR